MGALIRWLRHGSDAEHDLAVAFLEFGEGDAKAALGSLLAASADFVGKDSKAGKVMAATLKTLTDGGFVALPTAQPATVAQQKS